MKHIDAADPADEDEQNHEWRLEDFEDWHTDEVQRLFLDLWDETGQPQQ